MFEGTFNPEKNRKDWLIYLKDIRLSGRLSRLLNVNTTSDLTLMLPPINDVELPLLDKLRETLTELNEDACCYPYSARCASDIKRLVNTFNSVYTKAQKISTERNAVINKLTSLSRTKFRLQRELLTGRLRSIATKNSTLSTLSNTIIQLERVSKKAKNLKVDFDNAQKYTALLKDKIERIFFARNNWKFKDMRGGAMGTDGFMLRNPNDEELLTPARMGQDGTFISHYTILEAIQEATSPLVSDNIDIHPEPWKNLLIIPHDIGGLPAGWRTQKKAKLGRAANEILASTRQAAALKADWPQFATFGVDGWENDLQKALSAGVHNVHLHAQVQIGFDKDYGTIRPNVPWWDNSILQSQNKSQIGEHGVGNHFHKKNGSLISQVGFVWEYKIPQHSRATLADTPWEMAMDKNDDPYESFNLPRGTSIYAVRLSFIRADGSVVPISNVLTGRDVDRHFKAKVSRSLNGSSSLSNNEFTTVTLEDQQRLTDKAISLLGCKAGKNINRLQAVLSAERAKLSVRDQQFTITSGEFNDINDMRTKIKLRMASYDEEINQLMADGWTAPGGSDIKNYINLEEAQVRTNTDLALSGTPLNKGATYFDLTKLDSENIDDTLDTVGGSKRRRALLGVLDGFKYNASVASDPQDAQIENMVDIYIQCKLILEGSETKWIVEMIANDAAASCYNAQLDVVQSFERESNNWMAGGNIQVNDTEYAPGLISKEREINQIVSFTQHSWPGLQSSANPRGLWDPMDPSQLLPKAACLHLEPWLRKYKNEERLGFLNTGSLRASNWNANNPVPDVDSECLEHSYTTWNAGEDAIASMWRAQRHNITNYTSRAEAMIEKYYTSQNTVIAREFAENAADMAAQREYERKIEALRRQTAAAVAIQDKEIKDLEQKLTSDTGRLADVIAGRKRALQYLKDAGGLGDQIKEQMAKKIEDVNTELMDVIKVKLPAIELKIQDQITVLQKLQLEVVKWTQYVPDATYSQNDVDIQLKKATTAFDDAQKIQNDNEQELRALQTKKRSLERELNKLYTEAGLEYNTYIQRDIDLATAKISALQRKMDRDKAAFEASKELDQKRFAEESELLNKMVKEVDEQFRAKMRYGDICMGRDNLVSKETAQNGEHEKVTAPADLRFGGGYLWKYAEKIDKKIPLGEYLVYRENSGHKNRLIRAWSGVGLSKNEGERDANGDGQIMLYESPSAAMTGSLKINTKNDFVQPVLNDQIQVSVPGKQTRALFKVTQFTGSFGTSLDEVYYLGKGKDVGPASEAIIEGYRTPFKPGTYVYFRLKTPGSLAANTRDRHYDRAVEVPKGMRVDSSIDLATGVAMSGIIKTIRIMNAATAEPSQKKANAAKDVEDAKTLVAGAGADAVARETALSNLARKKEAFNLLHRENGKFNYSKFFADAITGGTWGPLNTAMIPILVADIIIAGGHIIKNVPYTDINRVLPVRGDVLNKVIYNDDGYWREALASTSGIKSHDNIMVYSSRAMDYIPMEVHIEDVRPLYQDGTNVIYDDGNLLKLATTEWAGNGKYKLMDAFGNQISGTPLKYQDDISLLVATGANALRYIVEGNSNELSMNIVEGLEYTTFIPKWTKITNDGTYTVEDQIQGYIATNFRRNVVDTNIREWNSNPNKVEPLFRAVIKPKRTLKTVAVNSYPIGTSMSTMNTAVARLNALPNKLRVGGTTQEVEDVVCWVSYFGTNRDQSPNDYGSINHKDNDGNVITGSFIQIVTKNDGGGKEVSNVRWDEVGEILLPQVGTDIGNFKKTSGFGYVHLDFFRGTMKARAAALSLAAPQNWNLKPNFVRAAVKASQLKTTFALSSGTEGDSETQLDEEDDAKGWTSSWTKTEQVIAQWASSTSDSSEAEVARMSGTETKVVPTWATSSSSDEKILESNDSAWASSTSLSKQSGGFASATSEDDMDNLSAIISKLERGSNQRSAAWAEDSDSDD